MKFLEHNEKVLLVIMIMLTLISITISTYLSINQTETNIKTCCNKNLYVIQGGGEIENDFKEKYSGLKNKISEYDIIAYDPRITASNMTSRDWNQIAADIVKEYNNYDGFVIVGAQDTIPYTASALSFILENLTKPVVISGDDLSNSLVLASSTKFPEVMVASEGKLIRGSRSVANSTGGFTSPNYPTLTKKTVLPPPTEKFNTKFFNNEKVMISINNR